MSLWDEMRNYDKAKEFYDLAWETKYNLCELKDMANRLGLFDEAAKFAKMESKFESKLWPVVKDYRHQIKDRIIKSETN